MNLNENSFTSGTISVCAGTLKYILYRVCMWSSNIQIFHTFQMKKKVYTNMLLCFHFLYYIKQGRILNTIQLSSND